MTVTNFTVPVSQVAANTPITSTPITAGTGTQFDAQIFIDFPNGLADWKGAGYAGLRVTMAGQHNEDGLGWHDICSVTYTAGTNHLPYLGCQWTPTNTAAQARISVTFSTSIQAGAHGSVTQTP